MKMGSSVATTETESCGFRPHEALSHARSEDPNDLRIEKLITKLCAHQVTESYPLK